MVMRVYNNTSEIKKVLELEGRSELAISMCVDGKSYTDWIEIQDYDGSISIKGRHVHEIISSILRFSSSKMRKHYRELLDMTDIVTGSKRIQDSDFSDADVSYEKRRRENESEWNKERIKDIRKFKLERLMEDKRYE